MFPTEALQPWAPLAVGAVLLLCVIAVIAGVIKNRLVRAAVAMPVVAFAAKAAWEYMVAKGI